jgi:hypothetical protein
VETRSRGRPTHRLGVAGRLLDRVLGIIQVDLPESLCVGRDRGLASRSTLQSFEQQVREQERREMVEGKGALEAVRGDCRVFQKPPPLLMSTSIRGRLTSASSASLRTFD